MRQLLVALALVVAACGGSAAPTTPDPGGDAAAATTSASGSTQTDTPARERPDGPDAPDFTLALGEGGTFTLSDEQRPVHMVFWAEW